MNNMNIKKILTISVILSTSLFLTSCEDNEEKKIMDDLDLEIQEFLEENPESDLNKIWDEKDEINDKIEASDKKTEEKKVASKSDKNKEDTKTVKKIDSKNIEIVKTVEEFSKCITKNWAKVYWTSWCWHCQKQKEMFWDSVKNLNFTDCDANRKACKSAWITWYPTWVIDWEKYPWVQNFKVLWEKTWCKLVKE